MPRGASLGRRDVVRARGEFPFRPPQMHTLGVGSIPRSIVVALEHDLVDRCKAGDDVVVTGTLTRRWSRISKGARCDLEVLVKANHVRIISDAHAGGIVTDGEPGRPAAAASPQA